MTAGPRLLYISPVLPALTGNGLAMRAGAVLEMLSSAYDVTLLTIPLYPSSAGCLPARLAERCGDAGLFPLWNLHPVPDGYGLRRFLPGSQRGGARTQLPFLRDHFAIVHLFRLSTLRLARPYLNASPRSRSRHQLDLDDVESRTHRRLAALYQLNGDMHGAVQAITAAQKFAHLESTVLGGFDRVYVCSPSDRTELQKRVGSEVQVLPNTVRLPVAQLPVRQSPFIFLFTGTLGYYPNEDAVRYFCIEVLPLIRSAARIPFQCHIVGASPTQSVVDVARIPEVQVIGPVPDMAPHYHSAGAAIVPIRAGGGTRIKVLEAFSHLRPVVSTTVGVEGLNIVPGVHFLVADDADSFAAQCIRLMEDHVLGLNLVMAAAEVVRSQYTIKAVTPILTTSHRPGASK